MGDDDQREISAQGIDRLHDLFFCCIVQRARRLVEDQELRILIKRACDTDALPLSSREAHTAFPYGGVISRGERFDEVGKLGLARGLANASHVDVLLLAADRDILGEACI